MCPLMSEWLMSLAPPAATRNEWHSGSHHCQPLTAVQPEMEEELGRQAGDTPCGTVHLLKGLLSGGGVWDSSSGARQNRLRHPPLAQLVRDITEGPKERGRQQLLPLQMQPPRPSTAPALSSRPPREQPDLSLSSPHRQLRAPWPLFGPSGSGALLDPFSRSIDVWPRRSGPCA